MPFMQVGLQDVITSQNPEFLLNKKSRQNEKELLDAIVKVRKEMKLTQKQLAELSFNTQQEISRLENRQNSPSLRIICRIVNSMGYEIILKKKEVSEEQSG